MVVERTSSIDGLSDEELYQLLEDSCNRDHHIGGVPCIDNGWHSPIWRIAPDAVAKISTGLSEAHTMQFVRNNTSIPVPTVRRVLPVRGTLAKDDTWIVMDYIEGNTLFELWDTLTDERKRDIFDVLARYVRELQSVPLPNPSIPGPLHPEGKPQKCNACFFSEHEAGPFDSYQEMADWFDRQRLRCRIYIHKLSGGSYLLPCPKFDATHPLVLCHMDIHPRNVIVDANGTLWLLDWGFAGAYPPWFEYADIVASVDGDYKLQTVPAWKDLAANASTIAGDYARYYDDYLGVLYYHTMGLNFDHLDYFGISDDYFEKLNIKAD